MLQSPPIPALPTTNPPPGTFWVEQEEAIFCAHAARFLRVDEMVQGEAIHGQEVSGKDD